MRAIAWLGLIVVVAIAGAGLVLSLDHPRTDAARPELTARGHALIAPRLAAIQPTLLALSAAGALLGTSGRGVLSGLRQLDPAAVTAALDAGDTALPALTSEGARLPSLREGLLDGPAAGRLPAADVDRIAAIDAAIAVT